MNTTIAESSFDAPIEPPVLEKQTIYRVDRSMCAPHGPIEPTVLEQQTIYAGFIRRAAAVMVDGILIVPVVLLAVWTHSQSWIVNILTMPLYMTLPLAYIIFCHGKWGQTIGKMAVGIQVRQVSGAPITWRQACLRNSVELAVALLLILFTIVSLAKVGPVRFNSLSHEQRDQLEASASDPTHFIQPVQSIWYLCELLVLLGSKKRRAIHDFIAGTMVVQVEDARSRHLQKILLWPCGLAFLAVVLLPIVLPQFFANRHAKALNHIHNNLRIIDGAKEQWALKERKQPGAIPTPEDLAPLLKNKKLPEPVAGEIYNINPIGVLPTARLNDSAGTTITNGFFERFP